MPTIDLTTPQERAWYKANGGHAHCPLGCEHPQERFLSDGRFVCGRCLVVDGVVTEVVGCTPEVCD